MIEQAAALGITYFDTAQAFAVPGPGMPGIDLDGPINILESFCVPARAPQSFAPDDPGIGIQRIDLQHPVEMR
jgi:hypothetical protein